MVYQERFLSRSVQHAVLRAALYGGGLHALRRWLWNNGYIKLRHRHQGVPQRRWRWIPDQPQLRTVSAPLPPRPHSLPHSLPYSLPYSFRLLIHTDSSSPTAGMSPIVSPSGFATRSASRARAVQISAYRDAGRTPRRPTTDEIPRCKSGSMALCV